MEPLGDYLKEIRENKKLSVEKVVEDTHIIKKFIIGIENDDFTVFPGEAYLKGFLRTYSEYLGLNSSDVIRRYEKIKLAETPSPIEQLIPKPGIDYSKILFFVLVIAGIGLLAGGIYALYGLIAKNQGEVKTVVKKEEKKKPVEPQEKTLVLEDNAGNFKLKKDEKVKVVLDDGVEYMIWLSDLDPTVNAVSSAGKEKFLIGNRYTNKFDINGDGKDDIEIVLNSWNDKTADLTIKKIVSSLQNDSNIDSKFFMSDTVETLYEGPTKSPVELAISILEDTYLKYQTDDQKDVEGMFAAGNVVNVKCNDQMILSLSNAAAVSLNFTGIQKKINPGEAGDVDVKIIAWTKSGSNYALQMSSLK